MPRTRRWGHVRHELADAFWAQRHGQLNDLLGHRWSAERVRDIPHDEIVAAAALIFGSC